MNLLRTFLSVILLGSLLPAVSQISPIPGYELKTGSPDPAPTAEPKPEADPKPGPAAVLDVHDTAAIEQAMGSEVTVEGKIHSAFWVNDSVLLLTFRQEREGFVAVSFAQYKEKLNQAFDGDITKALGGKTIRVTGKVQSYQNRPQIVVSSPDQIQVQ